jgi:drug/metabolite transporter (DMT)-like permease
MKVSAGALDWAMFFACVVMWGSAFALLQVAVTTAPPVWVTIMRLAIAVACLGVMAFLLKERLPPLRHVAVWRDYAIIGIVGTAIPFVLFAWASERAPSAAVAICNGGSPFFTALLAHFFAPGERLTMQRAASVTLGFAGLSILVGPALLRETGWDGAGIGLLAATLATFGYGVANVMTKTAPQVAPTIATLIYCMAGFAFVAPIGAFAPPTHAFSAASLWAIAALGVFGTAVGGYFFVLLVRRRGPVFVSFVTYLMPLWAMALGVLLLGERPGWNAGVALILVLAAMALFNWKPRSGAPSA